jgi:hypothetical protein
MKPNTAGMVHTSLTLAGTPFLFTGMAGHGRNPGALYLGFHGRMLVLDPRRHWSVPTPLSSGHSHLQLGKYMPLRFYLKMA